MKIEVTREFLRTNPDHIFVFGDNLVRRGHGGAAALRDEPNTYGFITKKAPTHNSCDYYRPREYAAIYEHQMLRLRDFVRRHPHHTFLISKLGSGLANEYQIWERVIEPRIKIDLAEFANVVFLW